MATSGAMADFARLPNDRKVLVFVVIGGLMGLIYYQFVYKGLRDDLANAEQENASKVALDKKLGDDIPLYEDLKTKVKELEEEISKDQEVLPTEAELPAFFETLERKIKQSGVEINRWQNLAQSNVDAFVKVPVEIELTGSFMQIKRFFASLVQKDVSPTNLTQKDEERERIVSVENLQLINPVVRNRELTLTAKFIAVTYRQDEQKLAPTVTPGAAAPSSSKPPMPSAPPPPPPPSAASPAGAKARTEEAIKKGDQVDRNAAGVEEAKTPAGSGADRLKGGM